MKTYLDDVSDITSSQFLQADAELLTNQTVTLLPDVLDRAQLVSQTVRSAERWQAYQNAIALFGFQQWLAERGVDIAAAIESSSVYDQAIAGLINGVCKLQVGQFKLCLVPLDSLTDDHVAVPRAALELEEYVPHLFIGVEVQEELNRVTFWGSLRLDTLRDRVGGDRLQDPADTDLETDDNWVYRIPKSWFHTDPNTVLLYLRCLDADAITIAPVIPAIQSSLATLEANLPVLRPRVQSSQRPLWKLLSWSQAIALYQNSSLALALLQSDAISTRTSHPNTAMNVGQWLQGQLDNVAQTLNWTLMPSLAPGFRSATSFRQVRPSLEQLEDVLRSLSVQGINVPPQARGGYVDIPINHQQVRLYAVIWDSSPTYDSREWTFLVVLDTPLDQPLRSDITLQIQDEHQVLQQQVLTPDATNAYLFLAVSGGWDEQFWVTLAADGDSAVSLPPFAFDPTDYI